MSSLEVRDLVMEYSPPARALDELSFKLAPGERMAVLGPSGSGKTTALRVIAGLVQPTSGDVLFDGRSVLREPPERRGAAMVFQDHTLFPFKTVAENVSFGLRLRKVDRKQRPVLVAAALKIVRLEGLADRWPDELSGGQRQRVALARALAVRPQLLLLDEPLTSLDQPLRMELRDEICRIQRTVGITTIFVTHDQSEAMAVGDRVAILIKGRLRQVGSPGALYSSPADVEVARFLGAENVLAGTKRGGRIETTIGILEVDDNGMPDGLVSVAIRSEHIELGTPGANRFVATIESSSAVGLTSDCAARVGKASLRFSTPPGQHPRTGESVTLRLPPEHISVVDRE